MGIRRKGWFWTGVGFVIAGGANWTFAAYSMAEEDISTAITFLFAAAILTGIGIFFIRIGRGASAITVVRKGWFWTGVVLLIAGMANWSLGASSMVEKDTDVAISSFITAAILTGVGIFCARRGGKLLPGMVLIPQEPAKQPEVAEKLRIVEEKVSKPMKRESDIARRKERRRKLWDGAYQAFLYTGVLLWIAFVQLAYFRGFDLGFLIAAASCTGLAVFCNKRRTSIVREQEIVGIKAMEGAEIRSGPSGKAILSLSDRKVTVDEFIVTQYSSGGLGGSGVSMKYPHTRIRVEHKGNIPCVIQVEAKRRELIRFFDKDIYIEWKSKYGQVRSEGDESIPGKVKIYGRKVATALPKEGIAKATDWAKRVLDDPNIGKLEGSIRVETDQILWVKRGGQPHHEFLERTAKVLVSMAKKIEKLG